MIVQMHILLRSGHHTAYHFAAHAAAFQDTNDNVDTYKRAMEMSVKLSRKENKLSCELTIIGGCHFGMSPL